MSEDREIREEATEEDMERQDKEWKKRGRERCGTFRSMVRPIRYTSDLGQLNQASYGLWEVFIHIPAFNI